MKTSNKKKNKNAVNAANALKEIKSETINVGNYLVNNPITIVPTKNTTAVKEITVPIPQEILSNVLFQTILSIGNKNIYTILDPKKYLLTLPSEIYSIKGLKIKRYTFKDKDVRNKYTYYTINKKTYAIESPSLKEEVNSLLRLVHYLKKF